MTKCKKQRRDQLKDKEIKKKNLSDSKEQYELRAANKPTIKETGSEPAEIN